MLTFRPLWLILVCILLLVPVAAGQSDVPLPPEIRILPPAQDVPRDQAAFSDKWFGRWDGMLVHVLIVEEIALDPSRVIVVYAWGRS